MSEEIKRCPFCGLPGDLYVTPTWIYEVFCDKCEIIMMALSKEEAIAKWNKRASDEATESKGTE